MTTRMRRKAEIKTKLEHCKKELLKLQEKSTHNIEEFEELMRLEGSVVALGWVLGIA